MPRGNGSYIGVDVEPTASEASGVWTVRESEAYLRAGEWPATPTVPGAPTGTPGDGQVALTWSAPTGGSPPTDYIIQYSSDAGSTWTTFEDGVSGATSVTVTGLTNGTGYIFRVVAINALGQGPYGSASGTITPIDPLVLLLHLDGSNNSTTFTDSSANAFAVTGYGNAKLTTTNPKFGAASLTLDGTGDYVQTASDAKFAFGTGDFTVEFWLYLDASHGNNGVFTFGDAEDATAGLNMNLVNGNIARVSTDGAGGSSLGVIGTGSWKHIAVTRAGTSLRLFVDGTQLGDTATDSTDLTGNSLKLGWYYSPDYAVNAKFDEVRVSRVALYTSNFTPPTSPF